MINLSLGQKIKYFRKRAGMSQLELEVSLGTSSGAMSRIESGKVNPTKETLSRISRILNLTPEEIASFFNLCEFEIPSSTDTKIKIMNKVNESLAGNIVLDDVVTTILDNLVYELGYSFSGLFLIKNNHLELHRIGLPNLLKTFFDKILNMDLLKVKFDLEDEECKRCLAVNCALNNTVTMSSSIADFSIPKYIDKNKEKILAKITGIHLLVGLPLNLKNIPLGSLIVASQDRNLSERNKELLQVFAHQISIAIFNAQIVEELVGIKNK